jgi:feruloyl esterase
MLSTESNWAALRAAPVVLGAALVAACGGGGDAVATMPQLTPATGATLVGTCDALAAKLAGLANTTITATTTVAAGTLTLAGQPVPAHCLVTGNMHSRVSSVDGQTYAIGFEMRLPAQWNGRFFYQANGGTDGNVVTATGAFGGGPQTHALLQGFAVLSSDAGHTAAQNPGFGADPQARLDYGYQAVGKLTPMAKSVINTAYGKGPDRSYLGGCSNGGRHTLVGAARYADQYDGFLAGSPGFNLPKAATRSIYRGQQYATLVADPTTPSGLGTAFTLAERKLLSSAVLAKCDALDLAADGLIQDSAACQAAFNLDTDVPTCAGARDGTCLSAAQKTVIANNFKGPKTSAGNPVYASFPFDSGHGGAGIAFWEFTAPLVLDPGAVGIIFKTPPEAVTGFNPPAFALGANIDTLVAQIGATNATYTESGLSFMTPPNPTDLSKLKNRGAKVIVYHGQSDPIFSVNDTAALFDGLATANSGDASNFARLFRVPGMGHCSGGPAADQFDLITPLVAWVEQGKAPDSVIATARGAGNTGGANADVPATWAANRTRPLCPYPKVARYSGSGSLEVAASFVCK